jgi:phospholipase/carboxylesterase
LYPLSASLPPVSRYFLLPEYRENEPLLRRLAEADPQQPNVGVMHISNAADERGGFSMYVPEYYAGESVPVVFALHGGSGHGRSFLWSWIKAARSKNVIVICPTSKDGTWSLMGPDIDSENLAAMLAYVQQHWQIEPAKILLSGMSDGGTFSYVSGLQSESPFTHLAPCSASFHPMLMEVADHDRVQNLPVYLMHGALDWMFPVDVARTARQFLTSAGAQVEYREIDNLSHTYPVEENPRILDWLNGELST